MMARDRFTRRASIRSCGRDQQRRIRRLVGPRRAWVVALALGVALLVGLAAAQDGPDGASIYQSLCASCHGQSGGGGIGPALAGNEALGDTAAAIRQVLRGGGGMPAFADQLSNAEIAAVLTHVRTAWGNDFGPVEASRVAEIRQGGEGAAAPGAEAGGEAAEQASEEQAPEEQAAEQQPEQQPEERPEDQAAQQAEQPEAQPEEQPDEEAAQPAGEPADRAVGQPPGQEAEAAPAREEPDAITPGPEDVLTEGFGTLALVVRPDEAQVEIAGPVGFGSRTGEGGEILLEELPPGAYRVTVTIGDERWVQTANLLRGGRIEMLFDLETGGG